MSKFKEFLQMDGPELRINPKDEFSPTIQFVDSPADGPYKFIIRKKAVGNANEVVAEETVEIPPFPFGSVLTTLFIMDVRMIGYYSDKIALVVIHY